jgi:hypothetical protein
MRPRLAVPGKAVVIPVVLSLAVAGSASAQLNNGQEQSVVVAHAQPHNTKGISCGDWNPDMSCLDFTTAWPIQSGADVYFIVANADSVLGVSGVSLGVDYGNTPGVQTDGQGCDVFGYAFCSDLQYTNGISDTDVTTEFPSAGGGNRLIWVRTTNCQRHVVYPFKVEAVACVFYVYAYGPDHFIVDMNRNLYTGPEFQIVDCPGPALSDMPWPTHAGYVDFGGGSGYNPCYPGGPVEGSTWGKLKTQYKR